MRRRTLLAPHGIELRDDLAAAGPVPVDDVLDAAAVAWTAGRIAPGVALCLPPDQPLEDGHPVADLALSQRRVVSRPRAAINSSTSSGRLAESACNTP